MPQSDASPAAPRARSRSLVGTLLSWLLGGLLLAVAAAAAFLPRILGTPERMSQFVAAAAPDLNADVRIGGVRMGWFGPIVLEDLKLVPRDGTAAPVTASRVEVSNGLGGIVMTLGDLGRVRVEGLRADITFDREHRSNIDSLRTAAVPGEPPGRRKSGPRRAAVRLRLEVEDAVARIAGPWTSEPWVSDPIDLRATLTNGTDGYAQWSIEPVQLLANAELTQTVAREVLAYIVPVLAESTRSSGRFSLRLDAARLPVGRPDAAEITGLLSMHEVNVGPGPLVENMFASLPLKLPPPPTVRIADESNIEFHLVDGRMWHRGLEFGIPLKAPGQRLDVTSEGSVGIADRSLDLKLSLPIPADLPQDRPLVAALAGKRISLGVGGVLGEPKVIFDGSIRDAAGQVLVDLIDRLRNGPRSPAVPPAAQPGPAPGPRGAGGPAAPPQPGWSPRAGDESEGKPADGAATDAPQAGDSTAETTTPDTPRAHAERIAAEAAGKAGADPGTTEAIVDIVGGLLDEVARRRAERRAAEAANPDQPPPRRGRLLQRRPPPPPAQPPAPSPGPAPTPSPD